MANLNLLEILDELGRFLFGLSPDVHDVLAFKVHVFTSDSKFWIAVNES